MDLYFSSGTYKMSNNVTIPSAIRLVFESRAMLSPDSGKTITINGDINAGLYKIFTGSGIITGVINVKETYPEWFGAIADGINDNSVAMYNAMGVINTAQNVPLNGLTECSTLYPTFASATPNINLYATITANSTTNASKSVDVDYLYVSHFR